MLEILCTNATNTPLDMLQGLVADGWQWRLYTNAKCISSDNIIVLHRDGFEYVLYSDRLTWHHLLSMFKAYGLHIGRAGAVY